MKNIFKLMIPCLAVAFSLTSCNDTMDDKASIDAQYEKASSTTASITGATAIDYQTIAGAGSVSSTSDVIEEGIQISTSSDFSADILSIPNDTIEASYELGASGLKELTTYYVRAYAMVKNGKIVVSESTTVTTPKMPLFSLDGAYSCVEYDLETGEPADPYEVTVEFDAEDPTIVHITNIWDGGMTVTGQYDEATGLVIVPNYEVIYVHPSYGDVWMRGVLADLSNYDSQIVFQFTAMGGTLVSTPFAAQCSAGNFGFLWVEMTHK